MAVPWLQRLRFEVPSDPDKQTSEERDFIVETQEWFEQYKRQIRNEGRCEGRSEGRKEHRIQLFEKRLGRALLEGERQLLERKLERVGEARLDDVLFELRGTALAAWLEDADAR